MGDKFFIMWVEVCYAPIPMGMYKFFRKKRPELTRPSMKNLDKEKAKALCKVLNDVWDIPVWEEKDGG